MRVALQAVLALLPTTVVAEQRSVHFDIASQPLSQALKAFGQISGQEIIFTEAVVAGRDTEGLKGEYTPEAAITRLLEGTGLIAERSPAGALMIRPVSDIHPDNSSSQSPTSRASREQVEEIVVTATKRQERLVDVPLSIQAVTGQQLERIGAVNFSDYARTIAGVSFLDSGPGRTQIFMRGVSTGGDVDTGKESTVGVYFDETPVTEGSSQPDLKLYDIDRVEVLRGPQGTLYGSGSMGGTIRVLTNQPNFSEAAGRVEGSGGLVDEGGLDGSVNAMLNVPLTDQVALRAVGYGVTNEGFLDNGLSGAKNINDEKTLGGRVALRIAPTEKLDVVVTGTHQRSEFGAFYQVSTRYPDPVIDQSEPEPFDDEFSIGNVKLQYDSGFATLTSSTSYFDRNRLFQNDIDWFAEAAFGIASVKSELSYDVSALSQEIRLASSGEGAWRWLLGGFYMDRDEDYRQTIDDRSAPPASNRAERFYFATTATGTRQLAGFGELSYDLLPNLTATAGLRVSKIDRELTAFKDGIAVGGIASEADGDFDERPATPKFNLSFKPADDALVYVQAAKGFRVGGVNPGLPPCDPANGCTVPVPDTFSSDSLWNYEVGAKLQMFDGVLALAAAGFYIEWTDIQLNVSRNDGFNGFMNAGDAVTKGVELEATANLGEHVRLGGQATYTSAKLTRLAPGILDVGAVDDHLPDVPKWAGATYLEWRTTLGDDTQVYVRGDVQYVGERNSDVESSSSNLALDAYTLLNLRLGLNVGAYGLAVFATNLTDERAQLSCEMIEGLRDGEPITLDRYTINRPRTIGLSVSREF